MRVSRRGFLLSLPPVVALAACRRQVGDTAARERLVALVTDRKVWEPVGNAWLAEHPEEDDVERLTTGLRDVLEWPRAAGGDTALARSVAERVRVDFRSGRVTSASGWVLSDTEARLAALVSRTPVGS